MYDFYTTPRDADERTHPDNHSDSISFVEFPFAKQEKNESAVRSETSFDDQSLSFDDWFSSPSNREIDNRYIDNNRIVGTPHTPASPDSGASVSHSKEDNQKTGFIY